LWIGYLVVAVAASSGGASRADDAAPSPLSRLEVGVRDLLAANPRPEDKSVQDLRGELLRLLETDAGRTQAEACLLLLLQLPPRPGKPPAAPEFPFDEATARRYQRDYAEWTGLPVAFRNGSGLSLVLVPPGTFRMGSPRDEPGHGAGGYDETLHTVTLTRPFYLGKHEVTIGQFRAFVAATQYVTDAEKTGGGHAHDARAEWKHRPGTQWRKPGYAGPFTLMETHPVVHVSHADSLAFCAWLNQQTRLGAKGPGYTLPTEAQWEWACRAGSAARYWWGKDEDTTGKVANAGDQALKRTHPEWPRTIMPAEDGQAFLAPVGSYRANGFGLHDTLGNVWEFCATRYGPYPREAVTDPEEGDPKRGFAVRGGGWSNTPSDVRCASRNADPPHFAHSNLGFRVALPLPVVASRGKTRYDKQER
jgi:formylglycine-generating enzyme required for sulfatase activity